MTGLNWGGQPGNLVAVGARGTYTIQSTSFGHVLQGTGHDELAMVALPSLGASYKTLDQAKDAAAALDSRSAVEAHIGGE
jgi:hypothetical protein